MGALAELPAKGERGKQGKTGPGPAGGTGGVGGEGGSGPGGGTGGEGGTGGATGVINGLGKKRWTHPEQAFFYLASCIAFGLLGAFIQNGWSL